MIRAVLMVFASWALGCCADPSPTLLRARTSVSADFAPTELLIFNEAIYEKHFKKYTFNVPVLIYSHTGDDLVSRESSSVEPVADARNRVFRVKGFIKEGTMWARDVTPFTITNEKGEKGLVTYYPWISDSRSTFDWLGETRAFGAGEWLQRQRTRFAKWHGDKALYAPRTLAEIIIENQNTLFGRKVYSFVRHLPLNIEGGNLLTNGAGSCFVSADVFTANFLYRRNEIKKLLQTRLGCETLHVVMPPGYRARDVDSMHADWALAMLSPRHLLVTDGAAEEANHVAPGFDFTILSRAAARGVQILQVNGQIFLPDLGADNNRTLQSSIVNVGRDCPYAVTDAPLKFFFEDVSEEVREKGAGIHCMSGQLH